MLEEYISTLPTTSKLPHIAILENQQAYLYFASLLASQGRLEESAANYRLLTEAARTQLDRWSSTISTLEEDLKKKPNPVSESDRRSDFLNQLRSAFLDLRASSAAHHHDYAKTLEFLGENMKAQTAYETALELFVTFRDKDPQTFGMMSSSLGMLYEHLGEYKRALPHHAVALRSCPAVERHDHPNLATILHPVHTPKDTPQERKRLEAILEQADPSWRQNASSKQASDLTSAESSPPPQEGKVADAAENKQDTEPSLSTDDFLTAIKIEAQEEAVMLRAIVEEQRKRLGNRSMALLPGLLQLATLERRLTNFELSLQLVSEALELVSQVKGTSHSDYATVLMHKCIHYHVTDQLVEAEIAARAALALKEELLGVDHLHVGLIQYDLAHILSKRSLHSESFTYFQAAYDIFRVHLYEDHIYTISAKSAVTKGEEVSYLQSLEDVKTKFGNQKS